MKGPDFSGQPVLNNVRAFPGAVGLAALTRGAAGYSGTKTVRVVSKLDDTGVGSLRWAVEGPGREGTFVVFSVSGVINARSKIEITSDYITIFGQTSPGGICIAGVPLEVGIDSSAGVSHVIIQHLRSRAGSHIYNAANGNLNDAEAFRIWGSTDVMVDHCSFSWGLDETMSVTDYGGTPNERITISKCIISQGLEDPIPTNVGDGNHGFGSLWNAKNSSVANSIDFYKCYWPHNINRNPRIDGQGFCNVINCVTYDYSKFLNTVIIPMASGLQVNFIGNYTKAGVNSEGPISGPGRTGECNLFSVDLPSVIYNNPYNMIYTLNNFGMTRTADSDAEWCMVDYNLDVLADQGWQKSTKWPTPAGGVDITPDVLSDTNTETTSVASILADCGATKPIRDTHDTTMVSDFNAGGTGMGDYLEGANYDVTPGDWNASDYVQTGDGASDTSGDGIPDAWGAANIPGWTIGTDYSNTVSDNGYYWIERYAHDLS
jgi:hypothetical protein